MRQINDTWGCYLTDESYSYDKAGNITEYYEPGMMSEYFSYDTNKHIS